MYNKLYCSADFHNEYTALPNILIKDHMDLTIDGSFRGNLENMVTVHGYLALSFYTKGESIRKF